MIDPDCAPARWPVLVAAARWGRRWLLPVAVAACLYGAEGLLALVRWFVGWGLVDDRRAARVLGWSCVLAERAVRLYRHRPAPESMPREYGTGGPLFVLRLVLLAYVVALPVKLLAASPEDLVVGQGCRCHTLLWNTVAADRESPASETRVWP